MEDLNSYINEFNLVLKKVKLEDSELKRKMKSLKNNNKLCNDKKYPFNAVVSIIECIIKEKTKDAITIAKKQKEFITSLCSSYDIEYLKSLNSLLDTNFSEELARIYDNLNLCQLYFGFLESLFNSLLTVNLENFSEKNVNQKLNGFLKFLNEKYNNQDSEDENG